MKKALTVFAAAAMVSVMMASNAFAYIGWVRDTRFTPERWWYSTQDNFGDWYRGETGKVKWAWIDSNHDGLEECYCFGDDGWMKANQRTPDGYYVNEKGQWTVNGVVQTRSAHYYAPGARRSLRLRTARRNPSCFCFS